MPAMIGGFGKIKVNTKMNTNINTKSSVIKKYFSINIEKYKNLIRYMPYMEESKSELKLKSILGAYLAGLIEADGSIAVHNKNSKSKRYRPKILIVFSIPDKPLGEKLSSITKIGKLYNKPKQGCVIWCIQKTEDVIKMINLINGYMRTPKIEAVHRAVNWFNEFDGYSLDILTLDKSDIDSNAWLAGFTDGDGNFSINLTNRKKKGNITSKRVQIFFRLELRQTYHRDVPIIQGGTSYFEILDKIARYLGVNLYSRSRIQKDKVFYSYMVISHNIQSHNKVISYFNRFPLYSSKYLAYLDWKQVLTELMLREGKPLAKEDISRVETIKAQFNNKRVSFNFAHLNFLI